MSKATIILQDGTVAGTCTQAEARDGGTEEFDIFGECCYAFYSKRSDLVKIGRTITLATRWRALEAGCGMSLDLLAVWKTAEPKTLESRLHSRFAASRTFGEWFEGAIKENVLDLRLLEGITSPIPAAPPRISVEGDYEYLTTDEVAARIVVSRQTVAMWRANHIGPVSEKVKGSVRYPRAEFEAWLAAECARTRRGDGVKVSAQ